MYGSSSQAHASVFVRTCTERMPVHLNPGLNPSAATWAGDDQTKRPHFASKKLWWFSRKRLCHI